MDKVSQEQMEKEQSSWSSVQFCLHSCLSCNAGSFKTSFVVELQLKYCKTFKYDRQWHHDFDDLRSDMQWFSELEVENSQTACISFDLCATSNLGNVCLCLPTAKHILPVAMAWSLWGQCRNQTNTFNNGFKS